MAAYLARDRTLAVRHGKKRRTRQKTSRSGQFSIGPVNSGWHRAVLGNLPNCDYCLGPGSRMATISTTGRNLQMGLGHINRCHGRSYGRQSDALNGYKYLAQKAGYRLESSGLHQKTNDFGANRTDPATTVRLPHFQWFAQIISIDNTCAIMQFFRRGDLIRIHSSHCLTQLTISQPAQRRIILL